MGASNVYLYYIAGVFISIKLSFFLLGKHEIYLIFLLIKKKYPENHKGVENIQKNNLFQFKYTAH